MSEYNDHPHGRPMVMPRPTLCRFILPTHNRLEWLKESIQSVLYSKDVELWILANGCTDGTDEYLASLNDPRIHYFTRPVNHRGGYWLLSEKIPDDEGYLCLWTDDDHSLPLGIERKREMLNANPNLSMVFSGVRMMDEAGTDKGPGSMGQITNHDLTTGALNFRYLMCGDYIPTPTVMMRLKDFRPHLHILAETEHTLCDWALWLEAGFRGFDSGFVSEPTIRYRVHKKSDSVAFTQSGRYVDDHLRIWKHWAKRGYRPTKDEKLSIQKFLCGISIDCRRDVFAPVAELEAAFA